jgi:hypothetical protein
MEATMQKRKPGNNGPEVPAIGFGCMGMSLGYGGVADKQKLFPA